MKLVLILLMLFCIISNSVLALTIHDEPDSVEEKPSHKVVEEEEVVVRQQGLIEEILGLSIPALVILIGFIWAVLPMFAGRRRW